MPSVNLPVCVVVVVILATVNAVQQRSNPCKSSSDGLLPNPRSCAQYFNCSLPGGDRQYCSYPQLFNPDTQRCEHYTMVKCGTRYEPLSQCEQYREQPCEGARCTRGVGHGAPCWVSYPSCRGLPDGFNEWTKKSPSGNIVVCMKGRVVYTGYCKHGEFDKERGCIIPGC